MRMEGLGAPAPQEDMNKAIQENKNRREELIERNRKTQSLLNGLKIGETKSTMTEEEITQEIYDTEAEIRKLYDEEVTLKHKLNPYR